MSAGAAIHRRHNIRISGEGSITLLFVHGLGCDQSMWRAVAPAFERSAKVVLVDLVGFGGSDFSAYDPGRYESLEGHAQDLAAIAQSLGPQPVVLVGHSVGGTIGLLMDLLAPQAVAAHAMFSPSPCYINSAGYEGGFERKDIDAILALIDEDTERWSRTMAGTIMGPGQPAFTEELVRTFCRADPDAFRQLARATFLGDHRAALPAITKPVLLLQCSEDKIAPPSVGSYMHAQCVDSTLEVVQNAGHCPHLTAPKACIAALERFLQRLAAAGIQQAIDSWVEADKAASAAEKLLAEAAFRHHQNQGMEPDEDMVGNARMLRAFAADRLETAMNLMQTGPEKAGRSN
jgi:sigma-B regulation protein RsbQ